MSITTVLPFQPDVMSAAQLAAVSYLARYSGHTHALYTFQLRRWFAWCEANALDPLIGIQRAHVELYLTNAATVPLDVPSIGTEPQVAPRTDRPSDHRPVVAHFDM